jgi:hypothetical protein
MILLDAPLPSAEIAELAEPERESRNVERWLVFRYSPAALFSLKMSRATSTAGQTLLVPTPYAVKMAFLDAALCHGLNDDPEALVRTLVRARLRIGVPNHACVTGTIQSVRQERSQADLKRNPGLPLHRASIAMREFVHYQGDLRLAFDLETCPSALVVLLLQTAPAIRSLGRRGSFMQYLGWTRLAELDSTFTQPVETRGDDVAVLGQVATLDDFGPQASWDALNSFSPSEVKRDAHRKFVETTVPLAQYNTGPGFVHYCVPGFILEELRKPPRREGD